jgi:hypothetical protein
MRCYLGNGAEYTPPDDRRQATGPQRFAVGRGPRLKNPAHCGLMNRDTFEPLRPETSVKFLAPLDLWTVLWMAVA